MQLQRWFEWLFARNAPCGYPVDSDPTIIHIVDTFAIHGEKIAICITTYKDSTSRTVTMEQNPGIEKILAQIRHLMQEGRSRMNDDTWCSDCRTGYFLEYETAETEVSFRFFNFPTQEYAMIREVTQLKD